MAEESEQLKIAKRIMQSMGLDYDKQIRDFERLKQQVEKIYIEILNIRKIIVAIAQHIGLDIQIK